jgi:RNA polymerase sigma-70 factor (family 1)
VNQKQPLLKPLSAYSTYSDEQLLLHLSHNDRRAFEAIYHRYWKKLFTVAAYKLHSKQDAEDIVHEIFLTIWTRREQLNIRSLEAYLTTALKYMIIAHQERALTKTISLSHELNEQPSPTQYLQIDARFIEEKLTKELNSLPYKCRVVFTESRLKGKSNPEIARELNISRKMVEKHISSALRQLRPSFKEFLSLIIFTQLF